MSLFQGIILNSMQFADMYCRFGMANESTPIVLADVSCPKSTLLHLLRCDHNELVNRHLRLQNGCNHTKDVVVFCGEFSYSHNSYTLYW